VLIVARSVDEVAGYQHGRRPFLHQKLRASTHRPGVVEPHPDPPIRDEAHPLAFLRGGKPGKLGYVPLRVNKVRFDQTSSWREGHGFQQTE